jgi:hypothetical protein
MPKRLQWSKIDTTTRLPDGRILLKVVFMDSEGGTYEWAPKWRDVHQLFRKSLELENFNVPSSAWIKEFATTAKEVFDHCSGQIVDAYMAQGRLEGIEEGKLVLREHETTELNYDEAVTFLTTNRYPVAFELTKEWLRTWLGKSVRCLIINGIAVEVGAGY